MKATVEETLKKALDVLQGLGHIPNDIVVDIKIDRSKDKQHGDYACNLALVLAKPCKLPPRALADMLVKHMPDNPLIERVEIAGPGFINFFICADAQQEIIAKVLKEGHEFGRSQIGRGQKVLLEYVSANPTGPLHVGHGRSAAFGATLANLLAAAGFVVSREYYVNDAGRQMDILAVSVWLRYLSQVGETVIFPANGYRGEYVSAIAEAMVEQYGRDYVHNWFVVTESLPADEAQGGDKELYIDALIKQAKTLLGSSGFALFHQHALNAVLNDMKADLAEFGVAYDCWFSEQSLFQEGAIRKGIEALQQGGHTYDKDGALWFAATAFGDEKDRVLVRANGQTTYFASDVAYHWNKYARGFSRVIDIFGADHHGYVARVKAAVNALGHDARALDVLLVQFAILYRGSERVQMSTRSGSFVTLRELRDEVGNDAARFFYVMRKPEQHMDFDLELAKSRSNENPVYYIQYAHARISSVFRQLQERGLTFDETLGLANTALLTKPPETALMSLIDQYPDMLENAARHCEPHQIAYYLRELATGLHGYYNALPILCDPEALRCARLCLLKAVRQVLRNGLAILGVSAPESM